MAIKWSELKDGFGGVNLLAMRLAIHNRELARSYVSACVRHYDELMGRGLRDKNPVSYIYEQGWHVYSPDERVVLPTRLNDSGGTRLEELLMLANVTRVLQPKRVFEIGTFNGRTTSVFILNAPEDATIITIDLPPEDFVEEEATRCGYINTDLDLVQNRKADNFIHELRLSSRCQQIYSDSMKFDPAPYRNSVQLGFIDGAHALEYVRNDTIKMAAMMAERGLVFWHDYGGKGRFRPLAEYLESLSQQVPIYRVAGTTLAWAPAGSLRDLATVGLN